MRAQCDIIPITTYLSAMFTLHAAARDTCETQHMAHPDCETQHMVQAESSPPECFQQPARHAECRQCPRRVEIPLHNEIQDALPQFTEQNFLQKSRRMQSSCDDAPVMQTNCARSAHTRVVAEVLRQAPFGYAPRSHSKPAIRTCASPSRPMSAADLARL